MRTIFFILALFPAMLFAQTGTAETNFLENAASRVAGKVNPLTIGGYAQIDYNQPFGAGQLNNGMLEVHRVVLLFGYKYSEKLNFVTEIESEHVNEIYIEQAFLDYKLGKYLTLRSGLILIPMGIINEYHEPSTYNGVERPFIDNLLSPTTWRELGAGFTGNIPAVSLKYQAYMVTGFAGYKGTTALLDGKSGFRKGRQKGIMAFASSPDFTGRIDFYGLPKTTVGLSVYNGKTESTLFNGLDRSDSNGIARADSSVVGLTMAGADFRFQTSGIGIRGQVYYTSIRNSSQYNSFTGKDLGRAMTGWYLEAGYDILRVLSSTSTSLIPFMRYETADTHFRTDGSIFKNQAYKFHVLTTGISLKPDTDVALKTDVQIIKDGTGRITNTFNCGVAVWF